jgi:fumarylpyruvate hydrolase
MSTLPLPRVQPVAVPILNDQQTYPVRRVFCVGRNYADHAIEMGGTGREPPFFFLKPADALFPVPVGQTVDWPYPMATEDCHHEVELVVALACGGRQLSPEQAASCIWGYALGLDMTRRDRQAEMKKAGKPWEIGKAFDHGAPIGPLVPIGERGVLTEGAITLSVNGTVKQSGNLAQLIWPLAEMISELSKAWALEAGDLIFTGTPAGVGPVQRGDQVEASFEGLPSLSLRVV